MIGSTYVSAGAQNLPGLLKTTGGSLKMIRHSLWAGGGIEFDISRFHDYNYDGIFRGYGVGGFFSGYSARFCFD